MSDDTSMCACGCGGATSPGRRYVHGHNKRLSLDEYTVDPETGCWVWQRSLGSGGYGKIYVGRGRMALAHRVYYERLVGPIPAGLQLDHLCRNRACVNPAHLEPVTGGENVRRGMSPKLTAGDIPRIFAMRAAGALHREIAAAFGVTKQNIGDILKGDAWADVSPKRVLL